ncbi:MAG: hypothetical protein WD266_00295 [Balneolales bacterium]
MNCTGACFALAKNCLLISSSIFVIVSCGQAGQGVGHESNERETAVSIVGDQFQINGAPTYEGRIWTAADGREYPVEGLLMNARLVQGVFDDLNPETRGQWAYPDTRQWDPDRNSREFTGALASWREHGLLSYTINLQGGCPYGYCRNQPWDNSAFVPDGSLREGYMDRLEQVLDRTDELGMVAILGYFYFGQDDNLEDESAVIRAVENATEWVLDKGYTNVIVEINNECNIRYDDHEILQCERVHELIERAQNIERDGRSLYVSTSLAGGRVPSANIVEASDYILLHGNGVQDPERMVQMIRETRELDGYTPMPIVNNEDDQPWRASGQGWTGESNNFAAAVKNYTSWGYFDFRRDTERNDFNLGYQSVPVNWHISSERKRDFFDLLAEFTGSPGTPKVSLDVSRETNTVSVQIEGERDDAPVDQVELLINNQVVDSAREKPFEFRISEVPAGDHGVRARVTYRNGQRDVIVESPYYQNLWWPYGGI